MNKKCGAKKKQHINPNVFAIRVDILSMALKLAKNKQFKIYLFSNRHNTSLIPALDYQLFAKAFPAIMLP
jgi:hypothetical protein